MQLSIDRSIIHRCAEAATAYQLQLGESSQVVSPRSLGASLPIRPMKPRLRPKSHKPMDIESGYGTDSERSAYPDSPVSSEWTPINSPRERTLPSAKVTSTPRERTSRGAPEYQKRKYPKRSHIKDDEEAYATEESIEYPTWKSAVSPAKRAKLSKQTLPDDRVGWTEIEIDAAWSLAKLRKHNGKVGRSWRRESA